MMQENRFHETAPRLNQSAGGSRSMRFQHKNDMIVLKRMIQQLVGTLQSSTTFPIQPSFSFSTTRRPRLQRMVIYRPDDVRLATTMAFVAFISKRQQAPDAEVVRAIHDIDRELVTTLADVTDLLAYFSLELHSGQWYNLVLLRDGSTQKQITAFSLHGYAAHELAPQYYAWIRLHHGLIDGGLARGDLELQSTHYYTFSTMGSGAGAEGAEYYSVEAGYGASTEQ